jgi:hypothetical protein
LACPLCQFWLRRKRYARIIISLKSSIQLMIAACTCITWSGAARPLATKKNGLSAGFLLRPKFTVFEGAGDRRNPNVGSQSADTN